VLIEQTEALGESVEDPLFAFSVLYGEWVTNCVAFNGDKMLELATQFLALAEKWRTDVPLMMGNRLMGFSLMLTGEPALGRVHLDRAIALYDPVEHRPLAARFGQDVRTAILSFRALTLWLLGYPDAALADAGSALDHAREFDQTPTLAYALLVTSLTFTWCGKSAAAMANLDELATLVDEKGALFWKAVGMASEGCALALTGQTSNAIKMMTSGLGSRSVRQERHFLRPGIYRTSPRLMRSLDSLTMRGAASTRPC
jgi:hypothetical protein